MPEHAIWKLPVPLLEIPNSAANSLTIHDLRHYVGMVYGPIGAFLAEYFPAVSATPRCRGRITSAMARAAD
jgi:hypothetical protein